jgi:hypothetical protein
MQFCNTEFHAVATNYFSPGSQKQLLAAGNSRLGERSDLTDASGHGHCCAFPAKAHQAQAPKTQKGPKMTLRAL